MHNKELEECTIEFPSYCTKTKIPDRECLLIRFDEIHIEKMIEYNEIPNEGVDKIQKIVKLKK